MDVSRCSHANQRQGNLQKSVLQLVLLLFFTILVKGIQRLFSVNICSEKQILPTIFFHLAKIF